MNMTPSDIAREAAEAYIPENPDNPAEDALYRQCDVDDLAALILSAAAKMHAEGEPIWAVYHSGVFQDARPSKREAECYASGFSTPCEIREMMMVVRSLTEQTGEGRP